MTNLTNTTGYRVGITNFWDKSDYVSKNRTKAMKRFFLMYFIQQLLNGWFIINGFLLKHTQLYKRAMRRILSQRPNEMMSSISRPFRARVDVHRRWSVSVWVVCIVSQSIPIVIGAMV